jgi:hypothetical protein
MLLIVSFFWFWKCVLAWSLFIPLPFFLFFAVMWFDLHGHIYTQDIRMTFSFLFLSPSKVVLLPMAPRPAPAQNDTRSGLAQGSTHTMRKRDRTYSWMRPGMASSLALKMAAFVALSSGTPKASWSAYRDESDVKPARSVD